MFYYSFQHGIFQYLFLTLVLIGSSSGELESNIICRFPGNGHNIFWSGGFVSGTIELVNNDYNDLKLKSIEAQLIGEFVYTKEKEQNSNKSRTIDQSWNKSSTIDRSWNKSSTIDRSWNKSSTTDRKTFFKKVVILRSGRDENTFHLPYGNHAWPFRLLLNDFLPPSLERTTSNGPYIHYFLRIVFVRPEWYKWNIEKTFPIVVKHASPRVNATQIEEQKTNRKGVHLQVVLHNSAVSSGKNFSFAVNIRNPKQNLIRRISVKLVQTRHLSPTGKTQSYLINRDLEKIHRLRDANVHENFQMYVPHTALPTLSFHLPLSYDTLSLVVQYELHFQLHLRGFFTNIRLQLPLIVTNYPENN